MIILFFDAEIVCFVHLPISLLSFVCGHMHLYKTNSVLSKYSLFLSHAHFNTIPAVKLNWLVFKTVHNQHTVECIYSTTKIFNYGSVSFDCTIDIEGGEGEREVVGSRVAERKSLDENRSASAFQC